MHPAEPGYLEQRAQELAGPVVRTVVDPATLRSSTKRTLDQRRRDRAAGVDRHGRLLPRVAGTNPRARRARRPRSSSTS